MPSPRQRDAPTNRAQILETTRSIARREGWGAVTIRKIAEELGYTSPIIYEHFRNKEEVLSEVMRQGFLDLASALQSTQPASRTPELYLLALAEAYWTFAQEKPEVYEIMHGMGGVAIEQGETARGAEEVCKLAMTALVDWANAEHVELANPLETTEILWATLHGITCLGLADRLGGEDQRPLRLARTAVATLLSGWRLPPPPR